VQLPQDRFSRSWSFRPSPSTVPHSQRRNSSENVEAPGVMPAGTPMPPSEPTSLLSSVRRIASSSLTLPVRSADGPKDFSTAGLRKPPGSRLEVGAMGSVNVLGSAKTERSFSAQRRRASPPASSATNLLRKNIGRRSASPGGALLRIGLSLESRPRQAPLESADAHPMPSSDGESARSLPCPLSPPKHQIDGQARWSFGQVKDEERTTCAQDPVQNDECAGSGEVPCDAVEPVQSDECATDMEECASNLEENSDPNVNAALDDKKGAEADVMKPAPKGKTNLSVANDVETLQGLAAGVLATIGGKEPNEQCIRGSVARIGPPNSWFSNSLAKKVDDISFAKKVEDTWLSMDSLRVRMEMLPGGLVIERDTNISDVAAMMAEVQNGELDVSEQVTQAEATMKHSDMLTKVAKLNELADSVEAEYLRWSKDPVAFPVDMTAKQQVYDWLVPITGEKPLILGQIQELGARRCMGLGNPTLALPSSEKPCRRFIQYGLYKAKVRRCPMCSKDSKRLVAVCATEAVRCSMLDAPPQEEGVKSVTIQESPPASIPVEARELAFALFAPCPNTYFRALLLPSDLEIAKENGTPVMVSWLDGDRRNRSVPTKDVFMLDDPRASDVAFASAAHWNEESRSLLPTLVGK